MNDDVERVKSRLNIVDVVGRKVSLKKAGKNFVGLCPFHSDSKPSLTVNPSLGIYKCFACGAGGDSIKFVQETERLSFGDALRQLADEVGVELSSKKDAPDAKLRESREAAMQFAHKFFVAQLAQNKVAQEYCRSRGIDEETIKKYGLGYAPEQGEALAIQLKKEGFNLADCRELFLVDQDPSGGYYDRFRSRLMFPIHNERGQLVAFGGRIIGNGIPKYINSSDTPLYSKRRILYGMNLAKAKMAESQRVVLVEGYLDAIACHRAGVLDAVASLGTAMSEEHAKLLSRWAKDAVVLYDADSAGQKAALRADEMLRAAGLRVKIALMPEGQDPDTLLRSAGPEMVLKAVDGGITPLRFHLSQLQSRLGTQSPEFWKEAVQLLAKAPTAMEAEEHIQELAGLYPGLTDRIAAGNAIRKQVTKIQGGKPEKTEESSPGRFYVEWPEATILRGLLEPSVARVCWGLLALPLMISPSARSLAGRLCALFPDGPEDIRPQSWLPKISAVDAQALTGLPNRDGRALNAEEIERAKQNLVQRMATKQRDQLKRKGDSEVSMLARSSSEKMVSAEVTLLRALLDPKLFKLAQNAIAEEDVMQHPEAVRLAKSVAEVTALEELDDEIKAELVGLDHGSSVELRPEILKECVAQMKRRATEQRLQSKKIGLADDEEALKRFSSELTRLKNRS
ncbi:MAG: DNA primase [Armatimonadetes bacterium]|nr:DNA primase [Armatimonadota bacterium]